MGSVTAGNCIDIGVYSGFAGGFQVPISNLCPVVPGNGLANNAPGANPMRASAAEPLSAFHAVTMGTNGIINADRLTPLHNGRVLGLVDNSYATLQTANVVTFGPITNPISGPGGWNFVPGLDIFLDTAGSITQVIPTAGFVNYLGYALSANTIFIDIERKESEGVNVVAYPYAATVNIDYNLLDVAAVGPLTGNMTLNMVNGRDGQKVQLRIQQDAVGNRVIVFGPNIAFPGNVAPALTAAPNSIDVLTFMYDGALSKYLMLSASLNYV